MKNFPKLQHKSELAKKHCRVIVLLLLSLANEYTNCYLCVHDERVLQVYD